jgi:hypothetical protein
MHVARSDKRRNSLSVKGPKRKSTRPQFDQNVGGGTGNLMKDRRRLHR